MSDADLGGLVGVKVIDKQGERYVGMSEADLGELVRE